MKPIIVFIIFLTLHHLLVAQPPRTGIKPCIDTSVYDKWPSLGAATITNDGQYVFYEINNYPPGGTTGVIQSTSKQWKIELTNISRVSFTENGCQAVFIKNEDSLCLFDLANKSATYIPHVSYFHLVKRNNSELLVYKVNDPKPKLVLKDLRTGSEKSWEDVYNYWHGHDGDVVVFQVVNKNDSSDISSLVCYSWKTNKQITFWKGSGFLDLKFDLTGTKLVFLVGNKSKEHTGETIWLYLKDMPKAFLLVEKAHLQLETGFRIESIKSISNDGRRVFINLKDQAVSQKSYAQEVKVDVWSYLDPKLPPALSSEVKPESYLAVLEINDKKLTRLQLKDDAELLTSQNKDDKYFIASSNKWGAASEYYWNITSKSTTWLVNARNGLREKVPNGRLSPNNKFIVYFNDSSGQLYSYSINDSSLRNISKLVPMPLSNDFNVSYGSESFGIAGWLQNDEKVLLYDEFDIWMVDLYGQEKPINLTNGYGRRNNVILRLMTNPLGTKVVTKKEKLLLTGYSRLTKENGIYEILTGKMSDPLCLTRGLYTYYAPQKVGVENHGYIPLKSKDSDIYLCRRESASESPNYYITKDFKNFTCLSNIYPEKNYNWMTAELHSWKASDGKILQGVLYKPENFDSTKKYPIIFYYYEIMSDMLTNYRAPSSSGNGLNVPSVVSNGYLVFTPDILYTIGNPLQSTYHSIVSAAKYLSKLPFVDSCKMGIQGNSWGGAQTNYLVTQTNLFAAACATAGTTDYISHQGDIGQTTKHHKFERGQYRLGANLWERPDWFFNSSPVMNVHRVTTPILLMNNKKDRAVPYEQGIEFITSLRRLGKRAWMLQYEDGGHSVSGEAGKDFTVRMMQFFDHYLKDSACPRWMFQKHISSEFITNDLELVREKNGNGKWITPPEGGLLTDEEKKKVDNLNQKGSVNITME